MVDFKFGGLSTTVHKYLCIVNILNLVVQKRIAKPTLIPPPPIL